MIYVFNCAPHGIDRLTLNDQPMAQNISGVGAKTNFRPVFIEAGTRIPGPQAPNEANFYDSNKLEIEWSGFLDEDIYDGNPKFDHSDMDDYCLFIFEKSMILMDLRNGQSGDKMTP